MLVQYIHILLKTNKHTKNCQLLQCPDLKNPDTNATIYRMTIHFEMVWHALTCMLEEEASGNCSQFNSDFFTNKKRYFIIILM